MHQTITASVAHQVIEDRIETAGRVRAARRLFRRRERRRAPSLATAPGRLRISGAGR
jgi:hypothetical protein